MQVFVRLNEELTLHYVQAMVLAVCMCVYVCVLALRVE